MNETLEKNNIHKLIKRFYELPARWLIIPVVTAAFLMVIIVIMLSSGAIGLQADFTPITRHLEARGAKLICDNSVALKSYTGVDHYTTYYLMPNDGQLKSTVRQALEQSQYSVTDQLLGGDDTTSPNPNYLGATQGGKQIEAKLIHDGEVSLRCEGRGHKYGEAYDVPSGQTVVQVELANKS